MVEINFRKKETFKTPDGEEYIINPLKRKNLKKLNKFVALNQRIDKLKIEGKGEEVNKLIFGEDEENDDEETLLKVADDIIDLSIKNIKTKDPLPEEDRLGIDITIQLCLLIINASAGNIKNLNVGGTPLAGNNESETSEQATTS